MLLQVSYQELKSLVLQYPYSPNLRYLLLLKSLFDQSKDFDRNQVLASLSSPDRKKLRQLVKQYSRIREIQENYALNEEFLELKDLSVLEDLVEEPNPATAFAPTGNGKAEAAVPPIATADGLEEEIEEESDLSFLKGLHFDQDEIAVLGEPEQAPTESLPEATTQSESEAPSFDDLLETDLAEAPAATDSSPDEAVAEVAPAPGAQPSPTPVIPLEITNEPDVQPMPKPRSSFNNWLKKLTPPQAGLLTTDLKDISLNNRPHLQPETIVEEDAKQIAEHSVEEDEEIASETLALLLEKQKLYTKAISMYERLQLKYPEKSSLFAAKIEELNKKM